MFIELIDWLIDLYDISMSYVIYVILFTAIVIEMIYVTISDWCNVWIILIIIDVKMIPTTSYYTPQILTASKSM